MKSLVKLVTIGIAVAAGVLLCLLWQRPPESARPAPGEIVSVRPVLPAAPSRDSWPSSFQGMRSQPPSNVSETTMAAIHSNLRRWLEAQRNGSEEDAEQSMQALQAKLTDQNAAEIIRSLSTDELNTPFGFAGIRHWMRADSVQASNWIATRPDATKDETWAVAQGWAADGAGLQNYLDQVPDTAWKQDLLQEASSQMSAADPVAAIELAQQMNPGSARASLLQTVAGNWIGSDPNAALAWINSVNDPSLREQLTAAAAQSYALTDPAQAAAWLASAVTSDGIAKDAALNIAQTWVTKDPAAAANWVSQFPEGDTKTAAVEVVSKYWRQTDPAAAAAWIQNLSGEAASGRR